MNLESVHFKVKHSCLYNIFYATTRKNTLLMAEFLSSLRDGGELSLMNGDNNRDGINLPRLWLLFFRIGKTYRVTS